VLIDNISAGPTTITLGTGNNNFKLDDSTIQQADITIGLEVAGATGSNTVDISNDTITGAHLNLSILNQSGVSGSGPNAKGGGSVNTLTMNNVNFTNSGNLNVRVDDGVNYFNAGNNTVLGASTVLMELIDTGGNVTVTVGDFFQSVMLGVGTPGLNDIDANNLTVYIGQGNDIIVITALLQGSENVTIGNVSTIPTPPLPTPSVLINGTVGLNHANEAGNETITLGTNANGKLTSGWPVTINQIVHGNLTITGGDVIALTIANSAIDGNLSITGGNAWTLDVSNTTVGGTLTIKLGNGGSLNTESLTLMNVTAADVNLSFASDAADAPDGNPNAGVIIDLINVSVTDPYGGLTLTDSGEGADILTMTSVAVAEQLTVSLSSGINTVVAQNVTTAFGMIDGGSGPSNLYVDRGANYGYFVFDFAGEIIGPNQPQMTSTDLSLSATTVNQGDTVTLSGSFTQSGDQDSHTVTINWGDGSANTQLQLAPGVFTFSATHTYVDEPPSGTSSKVDTITVTVANSAGDTASASTSITVNDVPPVVPAGGLVLSGATVEEGSPVSLSGTFVDPDATTPHQVVINWGDGSNPTSLTVAAGVFTFGPVSHTYQTRLPANAPFTIGVTVSDEDNASGSASIQVGVGNPPPANIQLGFTSATVNLGDPATLNGSFSDAGTLDSHTVVINWGDGSGNTTLNLSAGTLNFVASHFYQAALPSNASYTVQVTISDEDNASASASAMVTVIGGVGSGRPSGSVVPSLTLSGAARVDEGSTYTLDLSSRVPTGSTVSSVTVTWGDGQVQTVTGNPSSVTHVYSEGPNSYTILAEATDQSGSFMAGNMVGVQVMDAGPSLTLAGPTSANPLSPYTLNLSSSDPGTDSITGWTVNWGDGTTDSVVGDPTTATHSYALEHRSYTISAQATSADGTFPAGNTVTVNEVFPTPDENYIAQVYLDLLGRPVDLGGLESWTGHLQAGASRDQVVLWITQSLEYRTLRVEQLYQSYLGRPADTQALRDDIVALGAGETTDQLKADILGSDEYFAMRANGTMTGFFSALYTDVLGRSAKPSEIQGRIAGEPADASRTALASQFINSVEANNFLVQSLYQKYLHRNVDSTGLNDLVQSREGGATEESVIAAILASDEYFQRAVS
jgi:hypothetical protein